MGMISAAKSVARLGLATLALTLAGTLALVAQSNLFSPVAYVNDQVVTRYELNQRIALGAVLAGGITERAALEALVDERLRREAAARAGIRPTDEAIADAIREFAARGELEPEELLKVLATRGVAAESFRDFIVAGIAWRDYVRARFASRATVTEAEIDRALDDTGAGGGLRVLLSEIFLPARTPEELAQSERLAARIADNATLGSFAGAARQYSVAPSRERGGRMDWADLGDLPPPLRTAVAGLRPGEVSAPLSTGNAIGIFQLRAVDEAAVSRPAASAIEYAAYYIAGGRSDAALAEAARVAADVDTCDDLYQVAKGQPDEVLQIDTLPVGEIPQDVALELAKLDAGETSTALTRANGQTLVFLMLCGRSYGAPEEAGAEDRAAIATRLRDARLSSLADGHLAELKADATILFP